MKTVVALALLVFLAGCSKPKIVGRVVAQDDGTMQVEFRNGAGGCNFDNDAHPGDDVVISDQKVGTCHAIAHKD